MCVETGKPHAWKTDTNEKVQDLSILDVDEKYRRFLILTDQDCNLNVFRTAIDNACVTSLERMIECFPDWFEDDDHCPRIARCELCCEFKSIGWSREEHEQFKEALEYFASKGIAYRIEW